MNVLALWNDPAVAALASTRVLALLAAGPVFGHPALPMRIRFAFGLAIAAAIAPTGLEAHRGMEPGVELALAVAGEALVGLSLGFALSLVFAAIALLGEVIALQGGLGAAMALDPTSESSSAALSALFQLVALLIFLAIDGHHALLRAGKDSFEAIPLGSAGLTSLDFRSLFGLGAFVFEIAVRLAAPITVAMFAANVGVALLGRSLPQLNLMTLQLPALVGVALLLIGLGAGDLARWMSGALSQWPARVAVAAGIGG